MVSISVRGQFRALNVSTHQGIQSFLTSIQYQGNQQQASDLIRNAGISVDQDPNDQTQDGFIIDGPPGTGKTFVICTGSLRFLGYRDSIRSGNKRAVQIVIATLTNSASDRIIEQFDIIFDSIGLSDDEKSQLVCRVLSTSSTNSNQNLLQYSTTSGRPRDFSDEEWRQRRSYYNAVRIFVGTIYQIGTIINATNYQFRLQPAQASLILVDEASQISVSKLNIAFVKSGARLISMGLVGDRFQLRPISNLIDLQQDTISYLRQNNRIPDNKITQLNYQFRMHPVIRGLAELFGNYEPIQDAVDTSARNLGPNTFNQDNYSLSSVTEINEILNIENRIIIFDTSDNEAWGDVQIGTSRINIVEANAINNLNQLFLTFHPDLNANNILTVVPYSYQTSLISETYCRVGTVDRFQGQEGDLVIGGTVRVDEGSIDHIANQNRVNVMVSRARAKLILFIRRNLFIGNEIFETIFDYVDNENNSRIIEYTQSLHNDIISLLNT